MSRPGLRLSDEEREWIILERERRKESGVRTRLRSLLLCDEGKTMEQAAGTCVARSTVAGRNGFANTDKRDCKLSGKKGPYLGKAPQLSPEQYQELREIIRGGGLSQPAWPGYWGVGGCDSGGRSDQETLRSWYELIPGSPDSAQAGVFGSVPKTKTFKSRSGASENLGGSGITGD
ncbi:MAG: hypothetical protein WCP72_09625 [Desulfomonile sp.]